MATYKFFCNHCSKSFELETPIAKECPFCFWSSSIKREEEITAEKNKISSPKLTPVSHFDTKQFFHKLAFVLKSIFLLILLAGVIFLGFQLYSGWVNRNKESGLSIPINTKELKRPSLPVGKLSVEERDILYREVTLPEKLEPGPEEKKILEQTVTLKTGWSEKLPSPVWTLVQYQQMISEQEKFYKMPFARSYRKKLEELFTSKYLPGAEAFTQGDLLKARNLWVESLAFPLYSKDIMKHRAVALTMLRPFINDTLAKIRTLNQSLVMKEKRAKEEEVTAAYKQLSDLISQQNWAKAMTAIDQLQPRLDQLDAAAKQPAVPPPYPAAIGMVDQDIQRPLADLLTPNPVSVADLLSLKQDLAEKKDVLAALTGAELKTASDIYQNALTMIREEKWEEAIAALSSLQGPEVLKADAEAKIAIIRKIIGQGLETSH